MRARAAFTIVQNESVFLPLWLQYYQRYFDHSDIYVLDHETTDGSTDGLAGRCHHLRVHRDRSFDHAWLNGTVTAFQSFLLRSYAAVLFSEADEFVVADPAESPGLDRYIERFTGRVARCTGFEVVHDPAEEPSLQFEQPILPQRKYWQRSPMYSKPLIAREPVQWTLGFHEAASHPDIQPDPGLLLVHLHRVDYGYCVARHRATASRNWNEQDVQANYGFQNRLVEGDAFETWFVRGLDNRERELIPDHLKAVL